MKMKYTMTNHMIDELSEETDLAVIIDDSLNFRLHGQHQ